MAYVDKKLALKYVSNEKNFINIKNKFLLQYQNFTNELNDLIINKNYQLIYSKIHQIKGIALNIGSNILYEDSNYILDTIEKKRRSKFLYY